MNVQECPEFFCSFFFFFFFIVLVIEVVCQGMVNGQTNFVELKLLLIGSVL